MMTVDVLRKARELLAKPEAWIQGDFARSASGKSLEVSQFMIPGQASCFCLDGALISAKQCFDTQQEAKILGFARSSELARWNDAPERTHSEVLARLDAAIAKEESAHA